MNGFRKAVAVFVVAFIGIPVLIAITWAVGFTRGVVSPEFLSELPREIITRVPGMLDETLEALERDDIITDPRERAWVKAMTAMDVTPRELLEQIGMTRWLEEDLTQTLDKVGQILRGDLGPQPVTLNLRPLKAALKHEGIDRYINGLLEKLPPCTDAQIDEWGGIITMGTHHDPPPPCRPPQLAQASQSLRRIWIDEIDSIPDEVDMLNIEGKRIFIRGGTDITRFVVSVTYLLFLVPLGILLVGALIATFSGSGILRWLGVCTIIGGGLAFLLSRFTLKMAQWGMGIGPIAYSDIDFPMHEVGAVFVEKFGDIALTFMDHLFKTVNSTAGSVCIVGIVLIALSYLVPQKEQPPQQTTPPQPTPPQTTPPQTTPPLPPQATPPTG